MLINNVLDMPSEFIIYTVRCLLTNNTLDMPSQFIMYTVRSLLTFMILGKDKYHSFYLVLGSH